MTRESSLHPLLNPFESITEALVRQNAEIERLKAALEPFARNVDAVSLFATLGHITREDLWRARAALEPKP